MTRVFDFDEALGGTDTKQEPIVIAAFGQQWTIPPEGDARTVLKLQRVVTTMDEFEREASADPNRELSADERKRFQETIDFDWDGALRKLVGDDTADAWFEAGMSITQLVQMLLMLLAIYGGATQDDVARLGKLISDAAAGGSPEPQGQSAPEAEADTP